MHDDMYKAFNEMRKRLRAHMFNGLPPDIIQLDHMRHGADWLYDQDGKLSAPFRTDEWMEEDFHVQKL